MDRRVLLYLWVFASLSGETEWTLVDSSAESEHMAVVDDVVSGLLVTSYVFDREFVHQMSTSHM